eukprot:6455056-Amphidinium_carterae.1
MTTPSGSSSDRTIPADPVDASLSRDASSTACQFMGSTASVGIPCGSCGSFLYGPERNDYGRDFDMSSQVYGFPSCGPPNAGCLHQVPSASTGNLSGNINPTPCPPGLNPCVAGAGYHSHSLSFGPPPTNLDLVNPCAHLCSTLVHDCSYVSGGAMNTYEIAPDPYATVRHCRHCHDDYCASGVCYSCGMSCGQSLMSGPSTCNETEQVHGGFSPPPTRDLQCSGNRSGMGFVGTDSGIGQCVNGMSRDMPHCHGSPRFGRQGSVVTKGVAGAGAWTQMSLGASHEHEVDQISLEAISGPYIRQHVPVVCLLILMVVVIHRNHAHGIPFEHVSGISGVGHGPIHGASLDLTFAHDSPYHGNHSAMTYPASWENARRRESDSVSISDLPHPCMFRSWKLEVKRTVVAASMCPHEAFAWVSETDSLPPYHQSLAHPTHRFQTLDVKLSVALWKALGRRKLSRRIYIVAERFAEVGRFFSGRQMLSLVYEHFATESQNKQLHQIQDVMDLRRGGEAELEGFWSTWTYVVGDVGSALTVEVLREFNCFGTR